MAVGDVGRDSGDRRGWGPHSLSWDLGHSKNLVCTSVSPSVKWVHDSLQPKDRSDPIHRGEHVPCQAEGLLGSSLCRPKRPWPWQ